MFWCYNPFCKSMQASHHVTHIYPDKAQSALGSLGLLPRLDDTMQKATAYDMPLAVAVARSLPTLPTQKRMAFYAWTPDTTFWELKPAGITFPPNDFNAHVNGDKRTAGADSLITKLVSQDQKFEANLQERISAPCTESRDASAPIVANPIYVAFLCLCPSPLWGPRLGYQPSLSKTCTDSSRGRLHMGRAASAEHTQHQETSMSQRLTARLQFGHIDCTTV